MQYRQAKQSASHEPQRGMAIGIHPPGNQANPTRLLATPKTTIGLEIVALRDPEKTPALHRPNRLSE